MGRLTAEAQNKIQRLVESGRIRSGVTLVVVNSIFTDILQAWMAKPGAPPKDDILILACDAQAEEFWAKEGVAVVAHVTDGSWGDLVSKRHEVIALLCEAGVDAFYSDADAFWLRDPRGYCRSLPADLAVSQGTALPPEACRTWGFVLCTGFFYTRASRQTAAFFHSVAERAEHSDQVALNLALYESRTAWSHLSTPSEKISYRGPRWDESKPDICISYYDQPVFGRSDPLDIDLCLLPHRLFSRLGPTHETTMVAHLLDEKNEEWRRHIAALRARQAEGASLHLNNEADSSSARHPAATTRPRAESMRPATAMRKRLIIHIGLYKTGSTALQAFLAQNVAVLASSGIAYPFIAQRDDGGSGIAIGNIWLELIRLRQKYGSACSTDEMVELFLGETIGNAIAESSPNTILLSCEHLCSESALRIIGSFARDHDISVIAYVRDPYDLYVSRWKQRVKSQGEAAPFDAWLALRLCESEQSLFAILREFAALPINLILMSYDLHKERLVESFLQRIGVDPSQCNTEPYKGTTHNRSLSYEQAMLVTMALQNDALSKFSANLLSQFMSSPAALSDPTIHELDKKILAKEEREILFLNTVLPAGEKLRTTPRPAIAQSEISFSSENVSRTIRTLADHVVKAGLGGTRVASPVANPGLPSDFDAEEYLLRNPDVAMAGMAAEVHYMKYGRWENRVFRAGSADAPSTAHPVNGDVSTSGIGHQAFREPTPLEIRPQAGRKPLRYWLADLWQRAVGQLSRRGKS